VPLKTSTHTLQSIRRDQEQKPRTHPEGHTRTFCILITSKMLASTVQFSNNQRPRPAQTRLPTKTSSASGSRSTDRPVPGTTTEVAGDLRTQQCARQAPTPPAMFHHTPRTPPNPPKENPADQATQVLTPARPTLFRQCSTHEQPPPHANGVGRGHHTPPKRRALKLLRKEVIQPHLPVRLPCYDLVPIASPTFDHSPRRTGWAMGFGCYRLS
jgi:hypothetical protein